MDHPDPRSHSFPPPPLSRSLFSFGPGRLCLSHCADGPMPLRAALALEEMAGKELRPWDMDWETDFLGTQAALRQAAATLFGGLEADLSLSPCTSAGLQTVALGFPWEAGDEVVIPLGEFPSNRNPWLALSRKGVRLREIPLWTGQDGVSGVGPAHPPTAQADPEGRLIEALGPRTRILAVSWIRFQDGLKLDLDKLGRACGLRGIHLVVDGIQGAGTCVLALAHVSAFATGGHKGLLGPQGQGLLWTQEAFRQQLAPVGTWLANPGGVDSGSAQTAFEDLWVRDGRRLEPGSPSILGCKALLESVRILLEPGLVRIEAHVRWLQERLLESLLPSPFWNAEANRLQGLLASGRLGPTLCFHVPDPRTTADLLERSVTLGITTTVREGFLRIALHGWHSAEDVDLAVRWLKTAA